MDYESNIFILDGQAIQEFFSLLKYNFVKFREFTIKIIFQNILV
jgi:hypothetical protein